MLRAGNEPDIYYSYFTDLPQILQAGQAANITKYVNTTTMPNLSDIAAGAMKAVTTGGNTIYGLPTSDYTQGLIYNRKLFTEAGLNPDNPPTTWAQVETDATAIAKLGNGIEGWGDYSAGNNGGWHFSSYMDALGGTTVNNSGAAPTADFNNADGTAILQALHTLRFTDDAMSATQGLALGHAAAAVRRGQARHVHRGARRHLQRDHPAGQGQHQRHRDGPAAQPDRHPGGLAVRRQRLHLRPA